MRLQLRAPCATCDATTGTVTLTGGQLVARCSAEHYAYCVPKSELDDPLRVELARQQSAQKALWP